MVNAELWRSALDRTDWSVSCHFSFSK